MFLTHETAVHNNKATLPQVIDCQNVPIQCCLYEKKHLWKAHETSEYASKEKENFAKQSTPYNMTKLKTYYYP